jgi:hypothetical protein
MIRIRPFTPIPVSAAGPVRAAALAVRSASGCPLRAGRSAFPILPGAPPSHVSPPKPHATDAPVHE